MNLVISDPKIGKAYSKKIENIGIFLNKKIGNVVQLDSIGMPGYSAKITGGSDMCGFPMRFDLPGTVRKKIFIVKEKNKGLRRRVSVRGCVVGKDISQLNLVITKFGDKKLDGLIEKVGKKEKISAKESAMKEELLSAGQGKEAKEIKKAR